MQLTGKKRQKDCYCIPAKSDDLNALQQERVREIEQERGKGKKLTLSNV